MHLELDEKTLRKHYAKELDLGTELMCAMVGQDLLRVALRPSGGHPTVGACRYILGCRAGWKDTSRIEFEDHQRGLTAILQISQRRRTSRLRRRRRGRDLRDPLTRRGAAPPPLRRTTCPHLHPLASTGHLGTSGTWPVPDPSPIVSAAKRRGIAGREPQVPATSPLLRPPALKPLSS